MDYNLILDTDSYKASHWKQYDPSIDGIQFYIAARSFDCIFFGLQYILKKYLSKPVTRGNIDEAEKFFLAHGLPFNREGWEYILRYNDGYVPMFIRAVPEGTMVEAGKPMMVIEAHGPAFWIASYLETLLLRVWYPCTVATRSFEIKRLIKDWMERTSDGIEGLEYKLHDFGARGVSSRESSAIGGMAHLVNFRGSDTVEGVRAANEYYNDDMSAFSIPASEHSTITSWGKDRESAAYRNMVSNYGKPGSMFACVSDSYDLYRAVDSLWGKELKQDVIDSGATLVVRPDSGNPVHNVVQTVHTLANHYGYTTNSKGYKVINGPRVIQGDGITYSKIDDICRALKMSTYSVDNVAFGVGGKLLQDHSRDDFGFTMKCCAVRRGIGNWEGVSKESPNKKSLHGYQVIEDSKIVFNDGWVNPRATVTLQEVRDRVNDYLVYK